MFKSLGASKRALLVLDESVSAGGADPMPSLGPGFHEPNIWDDDDYDPAIATFENFDDEEEHEKERREALKPEHSDGV